MVTMDSPSAQRNKQPIWEVLESRVLPIVRKISNESISIIEFAAGCGVHTEYFTINLSEQKESSELIVNYYPTDPDPPSLEALVERVKSMNTHIGGMVHIIPPCSLTLDEHGCQEEETNKLLFSDQENCHLMICINMIHISPWSATQGLFHLAGAYLKPGGVLYTYGPYKENGTAVESNLNFDQSLRSRNPSWGVRNLEDVVALAEDNGLKLLEKVAMPANNLSLIFVKHKR